MKTVAAPLDRNSNDINGGFPYYNGCFLQSPARKREQKFYIVTQLNHGEKEGENRFKISNKIERK